MIVMQHTVSQNRCVVTPFSASHLLQGDSLSDGGHQIAPRVHSRGRRLRSGNLSELNLSTLQRGQHFIHRSYKNTAIKLKTDTFATMEEWREECIVRFQFQLHEAAENVRLNGCSVFKTFLKSSSTTSISQKAQKSAAQSDVTVSLPGAESISRTTTEVNWLLWPRGGSWEFRTRTTCTDTHTHRYTQTHTHTFLWNKQTRPSLQLDTFSHLYRDAPVNEHHNVSPPRTTFWCWLIKHA